MSVDASLTPSAATSGHATGTVASSHPVTGGDATGQATAERHAPVRDWLIPDVALRQWNTFGFDVRARFGATVDSADALWAVLRDPRVAGLPVHVLGGGSNIVLTGDLDALVIRIALRGRSIVSASTATGVGHVASAASARPHDDRSEIHPAAADVVRVRAGAGEPWHAFVDWTLAQRCPGLENLALIPGTVGAAPVQNIGAYGVEIADFFDVLTAMDRHTGEIREFNRDDCRFDYRDSIFKQTDGQRWIILSVTFALPRRWTPRRAYADLDQVLQARHCAMPTPRDIFDAVVAVRQAKLPDPAVIGNAGSFFKNPVIDAVRHAALKGREPDLVSYAQADGGYKLAAGWMIDRCGWKGRGLDADSPARVHDRQALVLTNAGGATGSQIMALAERIANDVERRFGVRLEAEPRVL
ncbi:UDP-N-acetylmuramate dehydrogenase [Robbsia andropogonis]|uniref:UDP-N-acetylmuramate dehydrogenase n=1 Tax=Robbsia andropogonis TaxID=28092 RepID=UPI002A6B6830|nr:UDP-N-acetylmuramate dehydrogenase [Robbsia andropogonis]